MKKNEKINLLEILFADAYKEYQPEFDIPGAWTDDLMAAIQTNSLKMEEERLIFKFSWIAVGISVAMLVISTFFIFAINNDDSINYELQTYFDEQSFDSLITDYIK